MGNLMSDLARRKSLMALMLAGGLLIAPGCVSVLPEAQGPESLVRMSPDALPSVAGELDASVVIDLPESRGAFAGPEVAAVEGNEIQFMSNVRWAVSPARMLQQTVVDMLQAADGEGWAAATSEGARADYEIVWTLRDLSFDNEEGAAVCRVRVTLIKRRGREFIAADVIEARIDSDRKTDSARALVLADAMEEASLKVAQFAIDQLAALPESDEPDEDSKPPSRRRET